MRINGKRKFLFSLILIFFVIGGKKIFAAGEAKEVIVKRLEAMDAALSQAVLVQLPLEFPDPEVVNSEEGEADEAQVKQARPEIKTPLVVEPLKVEKSMGGTIVWLVSLGLISSLGFLSWRRWKLNTENKLKSELAEKTKRAEIEEDLRKAIEQGSQQKEEECEQLKSSLESLKAEIAKKEVEEKEPSSEEEKVLWKFKDAEGKRKFPRLSLTRDFNKTIILRVKSPNLPQNIKVFAKNVSSRGLSFETKEEFKENDLINLRLFFYGGQVSSMKIQTRIVWKRKTELMNEYGVSFDLLEEKESLELKRYIEAKKEELAPAEV